MLCLAACGEDPYAANDGLEFRFASAHFDYRYSHTDRPDSAYQERHYAWVTQQLGLTATRKLEYRKYRDRAHLKRVTGKATNGWAEDRGYVFHTIWPIDNHEYVHALFLPNVGSPPPLFGEGVAVAHHGASIQGEFDGAPLWSGTSVHVLSARFRDRGTLPTLDAMLQADSFRALDDQVTYPVAGSFVRFLLDARGAAPFKTMSAKLSYSASRGTARQQFAAAYGESIDVWWERWLASLP